MKHTLLFLSLGLAVGAASCKKDDDNSNNNNNNNTPVCRITLSISNPGSADADSTLTTYNNDGSLAKIQTIDETNSSAPTYTYAHNGLSTIMTTTRPDGSVADRDSFVRNAAGYIVYHRTYDDPASTAVWNETLYEYNGNEVQKTTDRSHTGTAISSTTYTWSGGNMVSTLTGSTTTTYEYYTDKAYATGDFLEQLFQSAPGKLLANKNLFKRAASGSSEVASATYTMDGDGKITSMNFTFGSSTGRNDYTYTCK